MLMQEMIICLVCEVSTKRVAGDDSMLNAVAFAEKEFLLVRNILKVRARGCCADCLKVLQSQ